MDLRTALDVRYWPDVPRRIFILTLPLSGPLWLAIVTLIVAVLIVLICFLIPFKVLRGFWRGYE